MEQQEFMMLVSAIFNDEGDLAAKKLLREVSVTPQLQLRVVLKDGSEWLMNAVFSEESDADRLMEPGEALQSHLDQQEQHEAKLRWIEQGGSIGKGDER